MKRHVAVWIDHKVAHLFAVDVTPADATTVAAPLHDVHNRHPRGAEGTKDHPDDARRFFQEVARALDGADAVLIVGPSTAKLEFIRYVHRHAHAIEARVVGVETVDHPTDNQLVAYARTYFKRTDAARL